MDIQVRTKHSASGILVYGQESALALALWAEQGFEGLPTKVPCQDSPLGWKLQLPIPLGPETTPFTWGIKKRVQKGRATSFRRHLNYQQGGFCSIKIRRWDDWYTVSLSHQPPGRPLSDSPERKLWGLGIRRTPFDSEVHVRIPPIGGQIIIDFNWIHSAVVMGLPQEEVIEEEVLEAVTMAEAPYFHSLFLAETSFCQCYLSIYNLSPVFRTENAVLRGQALLDNAPLPEWQEPKPAYLTIEIIPTVLFLEAFRVVSIARRIAANLRKTAKQPAL